MKQQMYIINKDGILHFVDRASWYIYLCNFRLFIYFQSDVYQMMYWHNLILLMMSNGLLETC